MMFDPCQIVADQQHCHPPLATEPDEERHNLSTQRSIKRADRFIGDKIARAVRERGGDQHALPFSTRKPVRILCQPFFRARQADRLQHRDHRRLVGFCATCLHRSLDQMRAHGAVRRQCGQRLLKDKTQFFGAHAAEFAFRKPDQFDAVECRRTAGDTGA